MGVLGEIANPQIADIAGALDYRQAKSDREEAKRKEIKTNQIIGQALSTGLKEGSPMWQLAQENPQAFIGLNKHMGIDPSDGSGVHQMTVDVGIINKFNQADPTGQTTLNYMQTERDRRAKIGLSTDYLDKGIGAVTSNFPQFSRSVDLMNKTWNPPAAKEGYTLNEGDKRFDGNNQLVASGGVKTSSDGSGGLNSHAQDLATYKKMKAENDPDAEGFAQMVNLKSREGRELSSDVTKILNDLSVENVAAANAVTKYSNLANKIRNTTYMSGIGGKWQEAAKAMFGDEDAVTSIKKEAALIRNNEALKSLPAGSASEKDVAMVMEPMPDANSNPEYVAKWLDSYAKVSAGIEKYTAAKADFISANGAVRDKKGNNFINVWKSQNARDPQVNQAPQLGGQPAQTNQPTVSNW